MRLYAIAEIYAVDKNIDNYIPKLESGEINEGTVITDLLLDGEPSLLGYRLVNTKDKSYIDATLRSTIEYIKRGNRIEGLSIGKGDIISYNYEMSNNTIRKVHLPTIIVGLEYRLNGDEKWIAIGKDSVGLELVNRFGKLKNVTYNMILSDREWAFRILNTIIKEDVILSKGIEDSLIEYDRTGLVGRVKSKMDMLGVAEGYYIDDAGELIIDSNEKVRELIIPSVVNIIRPNAFYDCYNLTSVGIGKNVGLIGYEAFKNCKSLKEIEIPGNVKIIGDGAFENCINLSKVVLNEGIEKIGTMAFSDCKSLKEITLPKSIKGQAETDFDRVFGYSDIEVNVHIQFKQAIERYKEKKRLSNIDTIIKYYK